MEFSSSWNVYDYKNILKGWWIVWIKIKLFKNLSSSLIFRNLKPFKSFVQLYSRSSGCFPILIIISTACTYNYSGECQENVQLTSYFLEFSIEHNDLHSYFICCHNCSYSDLENTLPDLLSWANLYNINITVEKLETRQ